MRPRSVGEQRRGELVVVEEFRIGAGHLGDETEHLLIRTRQFGPAGPGPRPRSRRRTTRRWDFRPASNREGTTSNASGPPMLWPKNATGPGWGSAGLSIAQRRSARSGMLVYCDRSLPARLPGYWTATHRVPPVNPWRTVRRSRQSRRCAGICRAGLSHRLDRDQSVLTLNPLSLLVPQQSQ